MHLSRASGLAEFPDSKTERGLKHLNELGNMVEAGHRAVMLFLVQRPDAERFTLAGDIDPAYRDAYVRARSKGVEMLAYRCSVSPEEIAIDRAVDVDVR